MTRKRKLLEKQKEGKKRMKQLGKVEVSQDTFMSIVRWCVLPSQTEVLRRLCGVGERGELYDVFPCCVLGGGC